MKILSIISAFLVFCVCDAQTQEKAILYLKSTFPKPEKVVVGTGHFYDNHYFDRDNLPIEVQDLGLTNRLPQYKFYTFSLLFKGCYALETQRSILIYNIQTEKYFVLSRFGSGFQKEFVDLIGSYKTKNKRKLDEYLNSVASLLFFTIYVTEIAKINPSENKHIFYDPKTGDSVTFEMKKNKILNIVARR